MQVIIRHREHAFYCSSTIYFRPVFLYTCCEPMLRTAEVWLVQLNHWHIKSIHHASIMFFPVTIFEFTKLKLELNLVIAFHYQDIDFFTDPHIVCHNIISQLMFLDPGGSLSYFLRWSGHCSKESSSTRRRVSLWFFSFCWCWGSWPTNTHSSAASNKGSYSQWTCCKGEILWDLYALSSSSLLTLLHLQQLCWAFWSSLPLGGPMHWSGMIIASHGILDFMMCFVFIDVCYLLVCLVLK